MNRICSIEGCGRSSHYKDKGALGLCGKHYQRFAKHGSTEPPRAEPGAPEAFYQTTVLSHDGNGCLIWPYARNDRGAAVMRVIGDDRNVLVQRRACEDVHGPAPTKEHEAAHSCGKGHLGCVSPQHLRWDTHQGNMSDMGDHGTAQRGETMWAARLTEADVRAIRQEPASVTNSELARRYGVHRITILDARSGKTWAWLK